MKRHVVLVGLPGAGKSTVGGLVARQLDAPFVDLDVEIERDADVTIRELFARQGEARFRALEREGMRRALAAPPGVIAAGGGWVAQPGNLERAGGTALVLYLETEPATAARRTAGTLTRPLLNGDPGAALEALLREREPYYRRAAGTVSTTGQTPRQVADAVVALARDHGCW